MMYMPESPSDVYDLPQEWWDNLTETERMHIDFCIGLRPLEDMNAYHDQTVEECIEQINSGVISIEDFFDGNILEGITLDDLYTLKNNNYSMQDIENAIYGLSFETMRELLSKYDFDGKDNILGEVASHSNIFIETNYSIQPLSVNENELKKGNFIADVDKSGYADATGRPIWNIKLNGETALCQSHGSRCRTGDKYQFGYSFKDPLLGYFVMRAEKAQRENKMQILSYAQICSWYYRKQIGKYGGLYTTKSQFFEDMTKYYGDMHKYTSSQIEGICNQMWSIYSAALKNRVEYTVYVFYADRDDGQMLYTYRPPKPVPPTPPDTGDENPSITTSALTNEGLKSVNIKELSTISITDTISYSGFSKVTSGTVKGQAILKSSGQVLLETIQSMAFGSNGTLNIPYANINLSGLSNGDAIVIYEEVYDSTGKLLCSHKDINDSAQTIVLSETDSPPPPIDVDENTKYGSYTCSTNLRTEVKVQKFDIETGKPLQGVIFEFEGDNGFWYRGPTNQNGEVSDINLDTLTAFAEWTVKTGEYDKVVGKDSHGNDIKEKRYTFTCSSCGISEFTSTSERDTKAEEHCVEHSRQIAEADLDGQVAAYTFHWNVTEISPRTSEHSSSLLTGGTDSYTIGYHNNPVVTKSNTESGYHREENRTVPVPLTNERVRGTITINKSDMDYLNCRTEGDNNQDFIPQGDASLAGAVYGLYANADIIRPDGKSGDRTGLPTNIRMD